MLSRLQSSLAARPTLIATASAFAIGFVIVSTRHRRRALSATPSQRSPDWWRLSAVDAVAALSEGRVTPLELIESVAARIDETNPEVNAIVTLCLDRARQQAKQYASVGGAPGPLHGLPVVVKENQPIAGVLCTAGDRALASRVMTKSHSIVEDLEAAGGIVIGLSNMPEHAAGSHTFNDVFGTTCNPHDLSRTAGGSSGGSTAALAVGAAWLATGSDLGGSLRNPAAFCGVVGLRPSPGRCSMMPPPPSAWRGRWGIGLHSVQGPLARSVTDLALLLDALTAPALAGASASASAPASASASAPASASASAPASASASAPASASASAPASAPTSSVARNWVAECIPELLPPPRAGYLAHVRAAVAARGAASAYDKVRAGLPSQIAWSANLGGVLKGVDPEIGAAVRRAAEMLGAACGDGWANVQNASPAGLNDPHETFKALRFCRNLDEVAGGPGAVSDEYIQAHRGTTKPELMWEFEGAKVSGWQQRVAAAEHARQGIEASFCRLLEAFDVLVCPCTLMPPFDKRLRYPSRATPPTAAPKGTPSIELEDYIGWMLPCTVVSLANLPAISVPVGFTTPEAGDPSCRLPLAVQLVGRSGGEASLLAAAALLERAVAEQAAASTGGREGGMVCATTMGDVHVAPIDPVRPPSCPNAEQGAKAPSGRRRQYTWTGPTTEAEAQVHLNGARDAKRTQSH